MNHTEVTFSSALPKYAQDKLKAAAEQGKDAIDVLYPMPAYGDYPAYNEYIRIRPYPRKRAWYEVKIALRDLVFYGKALFGNAVELEWEKGFAGGLDTLFEIDNPAIEFVPGPAHEQPVPEPVPVSGIEDEDEIPF